ncbi:MULTISPECIES: heme o synthase [unclassified Devosia]|uniref:heme o synthase n=1 Tax=unclassified Devosia TaxID=196773 RepID=UPI00145F1806|nr:MULTISPECIES: heme o synthase [unclassified Devosia]MBJ6988280.1 protoheme IX farnesyltransferase [Devosia sp. MC521]MBJ7577554.1 protoheme IX farnesyltransferase [Devosia sp. MC532]QMW64443.1 protoheme IX farnesyltransferase [Devosia sp. MC521]
MAGGARVEDYISLLKPRVMSLVVFVGLVGMLVAPGSIHPVVGLIAIACIAIGAGASGALNMWYDSDIDAIMSRTVNRPIPAGRMQRNDALTFGVVLSVFSVMLLTLATNWFAGAFLAFTIFFYVVVYTMWLKRTTPQNIVIGGAAGAFPPMVGWAAVTGDVSWVSFSLFLIIFLWTPPHFWALALYKQGDYGAAGVPMMPNVAGEKSTRVQIFVYSLLLALSSVAPILLGFSSWIYGVVASVVAVGFVWHATRLLLANESVEMRKRARGLFTYSLSYLAILFLALLVDNFALRMGVL